MIAQEMDILTFNNIYISVSYKFYRKLCTFKLYQPGARPFSRAFSMQLIHLHAIIEIVLILHKFRRSRKF